MFPPDPGRESRSVSEVRLEKRKSQSGLRSFPRRSGPHCAIPRLYAECAAAPCRKSRVSRSRRRVRDIRSRSLDVLRLKFVFFYLVIFLPDHFFFYLHGQSLIAFLQCGLGRGQFPDGVRASCRPRTEGATRRAIPQVLSHILRAFSNSLEFSANLRISIAARGKIRAPPSAVRKLSAHFRARASPHVHTGRSGKRRGRNGCRDGVRNGAELTG